MGFTWVWNYFQSAVFSGVVSGSVSDPGLLKATIEGPDWLTGGSFGMEHSVVALVLCTTTGVLLLIARSAGVTFCRPSGHAEAEVRGA